MATLTAPEMPSEFLLTLEVDSKRPTPPSACRSCACSAQAGTPWAREPPGTCASSSAEESFSPRPLQELLRDYALGDVLGEGRFGTVWQCTHKKTRRQLACKQIRKVHGKDAYGPERELQCLSRVQQHPHVLQLESVFESKTHIFFVSEMCDAGDLLDFLSSAGPLPEDQAQPLFAQLLHALHHCHSRGVLHRDIKPENVLLHHCPTTGQKIIKLADFGLSTVLRTEGEKAVGWVGSEPYEAPEVMGLKPYDFSADVFSLGVVLFGMLSGTWPTYLFGRSFDAESNFAWPGWQSISQDAKNLIAQMLSEDPQLRPTATEALDHPWFHPLSPFPATPLSCAQNDEQMEWNILDDVFPDSAHGDWLFAPDLQTPSSSNVPASVADLWEPIPLSRTLSASELCATLV